MEFSVLSVPQVPLPDELRDHAFIRLCDRALGLKYPVPERLRAVLYEVTINIAVYLFHQAASYLEDAWYFLSLMTTQDSLFQQWDIALGGCVSGKSL